MKLLVPLLLECYWHLIRWTVRLRIQGLDLVEGELASGLVPVFAVPHHTIFLSALAYRNRSVTLLASMNKDGELAARFMKRRGFQLVRGSSSRGGKEALSELKNVVISGQPVALTFDGPRGPRLIPKPGVAICAWHASGSLFLLKHSIRTSRFFPKGICIRLKSWDRFVVPLPGCAMDVEFERIELPEKNQHPREQWVLAALQSIQEKTSAHYGDGR
ncbi:DUF374 domain-containing protein [bacterium]|nr:DUF374 domain-containing protein [bacterium]